jgi:hypothetical protein
MIIPFLTLSSKLIHKLSVINILVVNLESLNKA